jgi:hypothetical protein
MELGKAVTYIFEDKRWLSKLLIGWLVSLVPILNFAFSGYMTETIRNVEVDQAEPLPEWDDFGKKFMLGLYIWVAGIVFALPVIILASITAIPLIFASNGNMSDTVGALLAGTGLIVGCLVIVYGLAVSLLMPALNINLARKQTFGSVFQIGEFWRIFRADTGAYLTAWIMTLVFGIGIGLVGSVIAGIIGIIPCIGWLVAWVLMGLVVVAIQLVYAHLFGQVARKDLNAVH